MKISTGLSAFFITVGFLNGAAFAQSAIEERAQLLEAVENWCSKPNISGSKANNLTVEAGAGTTKILRGFGLAAEGNVSAEQVETLNFQLNGIRRSAEDCRAKSIGVLAEVFFGDNLSKALSTVTDKCQQTANLKVCVKTSDIRSFGRNIRIPLTIEAVNSNASVQFKDGGGSVFLSSGEEFPQKLSSGGIRLVNGVPVTQVFAAEVQDADAQAELALEIKLSNPVATSLWFDEIYWQ